MSPKAARTEVEAFGRTLSLSNPDKVMYPKTGFTKAQMVDYYSRIAPVLVPHLTGRPITFKRYPDGVDGQSFFEKHCPKHRPSWVETVEAPARGKVGTVPYCRIDEPAALVWAANLAALELHPGLQTADELNRPTWVVFDLDPGPPADVLACAEVAGWLRAALDHLGLMSALKTSGSKGLQLYVPLNTDTTFEATSRFALALAQVLERAHPDKVVTNMAKELRPGKVLIDWSQNSFSKTTVAVWSLRARERPWVSTPVTWDEVEGAAGAGDVERLRFEAPEALARVERHGDLFAPLLTERQVLPELG